MNIIRAYGPAATDPQINIVKPGDPIKWVTVDKPISTTIKPTATPHSPPKPKVLPPIPDSAIYTPGKDTNMDFLVRPTIQERLRLLNLEAKGKQWAARQPPSQGKIYDPDKEELWPYVVKLSPRAPRPNLKFNSETYIYISNHVKNRRPYQINPETKTNWAPPTNPPAHIAVKLNNKIIPRPPNLYRNQTPNHLIIRP